MEKGHMHKHGTLGNANSRDRQEECEGSREKDQRGPRRRGRSREKRKVQGTGRHSSCRRTARREPGHRNQRAGRGDIRLGVPVGPLYDRTEPPSVHCRRRVPASLHGLSPFLT